MWLHCLIDLCVVTGTERGGKQAESLKVSACYKSRDCWLDLEKSPNTWNQKSALASIKVKHQNLKAKAILLVLQPKSENSTDRKKFFWQTAQFEITGNC